MSEEPDIRTIPLEERLVHKSWKARQSAYEDYTKQFDNSRNEDDECFLMFNNQPELLKTIVTDSNVVAQETGILMFSKYLDLGATPKTLNRLKNVGIVPALCEKGLSSSRAGTKAKSTTCLLKCVEISDSPNGVVEAILPFTKHRLPKLVAGCVNALYQIIDAFGCTIISPGPIIETLPKLFAHNDRNVREETKVLTVELYKWMKDNLRKILFDDLKPVQQKELTTAFESVANDIPQQKTLTRAQVEQGRVAEEMSVEDDTFGESVAATQVATQVDPFDLVQPMVVLSKLPEDFQARINDPIWKERKAVLEDVHGVLSKVVKLTPKDDYTEIMRIFSKCMRDANIQVVQLAANCVEIVANGLRKNFHRYYPIVLVPMLERTKEKKPSVADALTNALVAVFHSTSLGDMLEGTLTAMTHKTPQVKISATNYLQKCLSQVDSCPTSREVEDIMTIGVKLLSESQEPIRQAGTNMIGTLMKITGERELKQFLEKVDENRKTKIFNVYETVEVNFNGSNKAAKPRSATAPNSVPSGIRRSNFAPPTSTVPSKRLATSPAKRVDQVPKASSYGRGLTGRSLTSNVSASIPRLSPSISRHDSMEVDSEDMNELRALREEQKQWIQSGDRHKATTEGLRMENISLKESVNEFKTLLESAERNNHVANTSLKQKDMEIARLNNDIEGLKLKVKDLENSIDMMKLQQKPTIQSSEAYPGLYNISPYKSRLYEESGQRSTSGDLSSRVNRLSIDGEGQKENVEQDRTSPPKRYDSFSGSFALEDREKDWTSAADITNQLKERIKKMKARTSIASNTHV
ncbi:hypothetical protein PSN45_000200 [Yamadazyma tenuis]|uniref:ARM repeat-containing protein n=1 Tax=Candida tenuis (strain ATCC 10573 / BCRC 21748 / CBS 615 / JCM 9827 / NBRC 10315 / NRRL Y-1498 / VKM Y-70) TaxID=590646 RepID=G3BB95_CANTC|nr:ARM repeat-containing protein [Yamadazyma tenuis ATCC 10573]EGV61523.1 ARM repeat-containing protein [Yamadazyma tenuis ATCC 10573]WEJ92745.1 hypothetical protein PSN45_000200 [Yamadazyma tenuis]